MDFSTLTNFDYILLSLMGAGFVIGLFKGFSGHLGSFVGLISALAVGYFCHEFALEVVDEFDVEPASMQRTAAIALNFTVCLISFGLVRILVSKFVSFLIPQPMNAILGGIIGFIISLAFIGIAVGFGIVRPEGDINAGIFPAKSVVIKNIAVVVDTYTAGAAD